MTIAVARGWHYASPRPTYAAMAILPPMVGPRAAIRDLAAFMRQRSRDQVIGAALAVLVTVIIVIIFLVDSKINTAPPPQIVYIENYGPDRTDADIVADQKKASAERRRAMEARRKEFEKLQKDLGIE